TLLAEHPALLARMLRLCRFATTTRIVVTVGVGSTREPLVRAGLEAFGFEVVSNRRLESEGAPESFMVLDESSAGPDQGFMARSRGRLAKAGIYHARFDPRLGLKVDGESWHVVEHQGLSPEGVLGPWNDGASQAVVSLVPRGSPHRRSTALPVVLMFDHPQWLRDLHAHLRIVLSAAGYRIREVSIEELQWVARGAAPVPEIERFITNSLLRVSANRTLGHRGSVEQRINSLFRGPVPASDLLGLASEAKGVVRGLVSIMRDTRAAMIVTVNGLTPESFLAARAAEACGMATFTLENSFLKDRCFVEAQTGAVGNRHTVARYSFDARADRELTGAEVRELDGYLASRDEKTSYDLTFSQPDHETQESLRQRLNIAAGRPIVLLLGQVAYDSVITLDNPHFESSLEFLRAVIARFAAKDDAELIVRLHPKEATEALDMTALALLEDGPLPANVRLVRGKEANTYSLMDLADVAITVNSQSGLEMIARGKPCLVAGDAFYARKGFTRDLGQARLLDASIDDLILHPDLTPKERERSRRFLHHLIFDFMVPHDFARFVPAIWNKLRSARLPAPQDLRAAVVPKREAMPLLSIILTASSPESRQAAIRSLRQSHLDVANYELMTIGGDEPSGGSIRRHWTGRNFGEDLRLAFGEARAPITVVIDDALEVGPDAWSQLLVRAADSQALIWPAPRLIGDFEGDWLAAAMAVGMPFRDPQGLVPRGFVAGPTTLMRRLLPPGAACDTPGAAELILIQRGAGLLDADERPLDQLILRVPESLPSLGSLAQRQGLARRLAGMANEPGHDESTLDNRRMESTKAIFDSLLAVSRNLPRPDLAGDRCQPILERLGRIVAAHLDACRRWGELQAEAASGPRSA
ncbi:MAG: hypothetical protein KDB53_15195, partial [Planctomycetes bacterium]|nr:hypothetical protein [Planctomycetota bacterium]